MDRAKTKIGGLNGSKKGKYVSEYRYLNFFLNVNLGECLPPDHVTNFYGSLLNNINK